MHSYNSFIKASLFCAYSVLPLHCAAAFPMQIVFYFDLNFKLFQMQNVCMCYTNNEKTEHFDPSLYCFHLIKLNVFVHGKYLPAARHVCRSRQRMFLKFQLHITHSRMCDECFFALPLSLSLVLPFKRCKQSKKVSEKYIFEKFILNFVI